MTISRVDASPRATFKAAYYLRGELITRYFDQESPAELWLEEELQGREREGLIWRVPFETGTGYRVRNLFGREGLILGLVVCCSDPKRNPSVDAVRSEPGRYNVTRCFSFGGKRQFGAAFASACLAFVRHNRLQLAHLQQMLGTAHAYLAYYQIEHYQDDAEIAAECSLALALYAEELRAESRPVREGQTSTA